MPQMPHEQIRFEQNSRETSKSNLTTRKGEIRTQSEADCWISKTLERKFFSIFQKKDKLEEEKIIQVQEI